MFYKQETVISLLRKLLRANFFDFLLFAFLPVQFACNIRSQVFHYFRERVIVIHIACAENQNDPFYSKGINRRKYDILNACTRVQDYGRMITYIYRVHCCKFGYTILNSRSPPPPYLTFLQQHFGNATLLTDQRVDETFYTSFGDRQEMISKREHRFA